MLIDPPPDPQRKPLSKFFTARMIEHGELPWFEIRALASIGAGLLMRHQGDPKAINKLARLSQPFDDYRHNETAKAMVTLLEDAAGGSYDPTEQDWEDLLTRAGISLDDYK